MKKFDCISSSFLFLFSVVLFIQARDLPYWGDLGPSSGFFPVVLSIFLGILSLAIFLRAWLKKDVSQESPKILGPKKGKFFLYTACFFAFGLLFARLGYSLTLIAFLAFILKVVERQSWRVTIGVTLASITVSYVLFVYFLSVPLPEGVLAPLLKR